MDDVIIIMSVSNLHTSLVLTMRKLLMSIFAIMISNLLLAQAPPIEWQRTVGGSLDDRPYDIIQTRDGGYFAVGSTRSNDGDVTDMHDSINYTSDMFVVRLDCGGNLLWTKCYGGSWYDNGFSVRQTLDGGFIIAGETDSNDGYLTGHISFGPGSTGGDIWVVKIDSMGTIQWHKWYGGNGQEWVHSIRLTSDKGYFITGRSNSSAGDFSSNHGDSDVYVLKIDSVGNTQWQKLFGGTLYDEGWEGEPTPDGGYIVAAYTQSNNGDVSGLYGNYDSWVLKLDSFGNIVWKYCYGGPGSEVANSVQPTTDKGYIVVGSTTANGGNVTGYQGSGRNLWAVKLDSMGIIQWEKCYGAPYGTMGFSVRKTPDGGYIYGGTATGNGGYVSGNHGQYTSDLWAVKTDSIGNVEWQKCLGGTDNDGVVEGIKMGPALDGGYIAIGNTRSNDGDVTGYHGGNTEDFWIVKLKGTNIADTPTVLIVDTCSGYLFKGTLLTQSGTYNDTIHITACKDSMVVLNLTIRPPATPEIIGELTTCENAPTILTVDSVLLYNHFSWSNADTFSSISVVSGNYTVTVTDSNGCIGTSPSVTVTNISPQVTIAGNTSFCAGDSTVLTAIPTVLSGVNYLWGTSDTTQTIVVNSEGSYSVTISYNNGCTADTSITVLSPYPSPLPEIVGALNTCHNTPSLLSVDSATLYTHFLWSNADSSSSISVLFGNYSVSVTDSNGCNGTSAQISVINSTPLTTINGNIAFCPGDSSMLTATTTFPSGASFLWSTSDTTPSILVNTPGTYFVSVTDSNACGSGDTVTVSLYSVPLANFTISPSNPTTTETEISYTDISTIATGTIVGWLWNFGNGATDSTQKPLSFMYNDEGEYPIVLIVESNNGCKDTVQNSITIESDFSFFIPSALTPNDDRLNDTFTGKGTSIKNFQMLIYDRWGELIYETNDINQPWNGKVKNHNEFVQNDVYVYSITVTSYKNAKHYYRGTVTVTR